MSNTYAFVNMSPIIFFHFSIIFVYFSISMSNVPLNETVLICASIKKIYLK